MVWWVFIIVLHPTQYIHMPDKISPVVDDGSFSSWNLMQIGKVGHSVEWCLYFVDVFVSGITGVSAFTLRRRRSEAPYCVSLSARLHQLEGRWAGRVRCDMACRHNEYGDHVRSETWERNNIQESWREWSENGGRNFDFQERKYF